MSLNLKKGKIIADLKSDKQLLNNIHYSDDKKGEKEIFLNNNKMSFFPHITEYKKDDKQNDRIVVLAPSGAGKSSIIREYIINFHNHFKKSPILLFSSKLDDEKLDDLKYINRVVIPEDILENPITIKEITNDNKNINTLCVFDDIEDYPNAKINKAVHRLMEEILRLGRSYGIYCIISHHVVNDYRATKNMLYEATALFIFPSRTPKNTYTHLLKNKLMITPENMEIINNTKSNWVYISRQQPYQIISDNYILLN